MSLLATVRGIVPRRRKRFPPRVVAALRFITLSDPAADPGLFPDFFIAGPQRTGTTWLFRNLRVHPEIVLSQPKELFYFNGLADPGRSRFGSTDLAQYLRHFEVTEDVRAPLQSRARDRFGVDFTPRVRGEATATYAAGVPAPIIQEIVALKPDIKVVLMVRDPVERAWSHAKKDLALESGRPVSAVPHHQLAAFLRDEYQVACGQFTRQRELWSTYLEPGCLFVGRFADVAERPVELLTRIMAFLGVDSDPSFASEDLTECVINPSERTDTVPEPHASFLHELFDEEIGRLRESGAL